MEESNITVSGGEQLSGISQGNGSHLVGETLTLNNNNWVAVEVNDTDDSNFGDSDNSQSLLNAIVYDGTSYTAGRPVEAEFALTVEDPDGNQYTVIAFNINEPGVASFRTVEGLAFIGGTADFPPIGVPLTVITNTEGPNFSSGDFADPPCFTSGTLIETPLGSTPIETLKPGDLVHTLDHGPQKIRWIGTRAFTYADLSQAPNLRPIYITAGALGHGLPKNDLSVSRQHRFLVSSKISERMFGPGDVLVAAAKLTALPGIYTDQAARTVTYFHILFDDHQVIFAEGAATESLYVGPRVLDSLPPKARAEILALFPELAMADHAHKPARPIPAPVRQKRLIARHAKNQKSLTRPNSTPSSR